MKKNKLAILLSLASLFGVNAYAQTEQPKEVPTTQNALAAQSQLLPNPESPIRAEEEKELNAKSGVAYAPAPPLTNMWIYAVGSTNCGWEYTSNLPVTNCNHGGQQLRAAVLEIGYGYSSFAWMNGGILPYSLYSSTPVCITNGRYNWPCAAGQIVVGFLKEYSLDGYQNGIFRYQNTSANWPQNTMSAQISIL
ncbi:YolA family protein [Photorhabdus luminescens]|uniref:YolA family protein n=1 Tax=Photorhabdus luminescens TaxID=29488 RepID=UPI00223F4CE9|nr:YolA family protein [Photorhabdus luminescens subsp. venezuelensis]